MPVPPVPHPTSRARNELTEAEVGRHSCTFANASSVRSRPSGLSRYAAYLLGSAWKRLSLLISVFTLSSNEVVQDIERHCKRPSCGSSEGATGEDRRSAG